MAAVGSMSLDGGASDPNSSGVALWLKSKSASAVSHSTQTGWRVTVAENQDLAVATTARSAPITELIEQGREAIEEALDLSCFRQNEPCELKPLGTDHFVVTSEEGKRIFTFRTTVQQKVRAGTVSVVIT